jgi:hypothetical protein
MMTIPKLKRLLLFAVLGGATGGALAFAYAAFGST